MTTEAATPKTIFPVIAGIGPYAIGWPYGGTDVVVTVVNNGVRTVLTGADFSLLPASSTTSGSVFLSSAAAALHAGAQMLAERSTPEEQGWAGVYPGEKGIEAQLDRTTRRLQELSQKLAGAIRIDGAASPGSVATDRLLMWDGEKIVPGPTADEIPAAQHYAETAQAWAIEDIDVPVEAGLYSSRHYAFQAQQSAAAAAGSAATINLPAVAGQALNFLQVNPGATGYRHRTPAQVRSDLSINGIGSDAAPTITNLNTLTVAGEYFSSPGATGAPNGTDSFSIKHYASNSVDFAFQEAFSYTSGARWWRREMSDVWQAWVQVQGAIGFTPVEQGGGANMGANKVRLGWEESTVGVLLQIDATTLGLIALRHEVPTWANTMGTIAAQPAGSVGTYALLMNEGVGANINIGDLVAGSNLRYVAASGAGTGTATVTPSGTWRCMGLSFASFFAPDDRTTLFLRIS